MAAPGYITTQLASLGSLAQGVLGRVFEYTFSNFKFGPAEHQGRAANFQWYALQATSPATPGEEFSIAHGLGSAPYLVVPVLDARVVGSTIAVSIARESDTKRIYLSCAVASAPVTVYVEGA